jgi:polar amino acid transport system substrate-binding protein
MKIRSVPSVRSLVASLSISTAVLAGSLVAAPAHAGALEDAKARGELVVGTEFQFAPFEFLNGDEPVGFDVDLMTLIAKDLGVKLKWMDLPWSSVLPALEARRYDMVVAGTSRTKARLQRYYMTLPIGDATVALIKRRDDTSITKSSDIQGKVIGGIKGSAELQVLQNYVAKLPGGVKELKVYIGSTNSYADLSAKRISAVGESLPNLSYLEKTRPEFQVVLPPFGPASYFSWTLRKEPDSQSLLKAVDDEIRKYDQDGTIKKLQVKWFGRAFPLPSATIPEPAY